MAFKLAASMAFKEAMRKAGATLLEPYMKVEVTVPDDYLGDVMGDINSRRGKLEGMDLVHGNQVIRCHIPLSKCLVTQQTFVLITSRGNYSMVFSHYEEVPAGLADEILGNK